MDPTTVIPALVSLIAALTGAEPDTIYSAINIGTGVITTASAIASITPTPKDDRWAGKAYKVVDFFALNVGRAKQPPPNRIESIY